MRTLCGTGGGRLAVAPPPAALDPERALSGAPRLGHWPPAVPLQAAL
jgi:hypothetical protein